MTEKELSQYRAIKDEIDLLTKKINNNNKEECIITDKVKGSSKHFPYIDRNFTITGIDLEKEYKNKEKISRLKQKREKKRTELIKKEEELHDFIYSISDSRDRQIFILRFIDGLSQKAIGSRLHIDQSVVSRRITKYLTKEHAQKKRK